MLCDEWDRTVGGLFQTRRFRRPVRDLLGHRAGVELSERAYGVREVHLFVGAFRGLLDRGLSVEPLRRSVIAAVTNAIMVVSRRTQCIRTRRCRSRGMRVASMVVAPSEPATSQSVTSGCLECKLAMI
jgi:hypothetical protein